MRDRCSGCPNRDQPVVPGRGTPGGVAIVGQAPGTTEARRGRIFSGRSGELLENMVSQSDLHPVYYTNAVVCACPTEVPTDDQVAACRESLIEELQEHRITKVLAMGNSSVQALVPGSKNITSLRPNRLFSTELQVPVVPTMNAAAALYDPSVFADIAVDFGILQTIDTWSPHWTVECPPPYKVVDTVRDFIDMINTIDTSKHLALDIETTGFNPIEDRLISVGFGDEHTVWIVTAELMYGSKFVRANVQRLLEDPGMVWVAQNGYQFDWKWLWVNFSIDWRISFDPMLAHYALDERQSGHNLKSLCREYLGYPDYAVDIKGRFENYGDVPRDQLWQYQAWDVRGAWELYEPLMEEMRSDEDTDLVKLHDEILLPGSKALAIVELNGVCIDEPYLEKVGRQLDEEMQNIREQLQEMSDELGVTNLQRAIDEEISCRERHEWALEAQARGDISGRERIQIRASHTRSKAAVLENTFNPGSPVQVKRLICQRLGLTSDTTKEGLELVVDKHPAPKLISEYRIKSKLKSTNVEGLIVKRWASTSRVHGNFLIIGTRTGRLSGQEPNWQNIPILVGPIIRNGIVPTPGWKLAEIDNSQVELRIAAVLSEDQRLIDVYREGRDVHREVAVTMYHKPADQITDRERYYAKYVDFPILFGATAESLVGTGDPPWDLRTARTFVDGFLSGFPQLASWMDGQRQRVKENGFVLTLFGRKRRYPLILESTVGDIERQSINSPIQGSASDLCLTALTRVVLFLHERRKAGFPEECRVLLTVHDSILIEAVEDKIEFYTTWVKTQMQRIPENWNRLGLPFKAEAKIGSRWGSLKEYEPAQELIDVCIREDLTFQNPGEVRSVDLRDSRSRRDVVLA